jgi:hypothetical protein
VQGRLQHLKIARIALYRASVRENCVEEEHDELEVLLDEFIMEFEEYTAIEADRRDTARAREAEITEGGRQARDIILRSKLSLQGMKWIWKAMRM